jgi:hypothetical protein
MVFSSNPRDALAVAHQHARHLRAERAAERLRRGSVTRRALAASLRSAANRLDPAPLAPRRA